MTTEFADIAGKIEAGTDVSGPSEGDVAVRRKDIATKMYKIGDKFTDVAINLPNIKQARTAFDVAERAYRLALELDPVPRPESFTVFDFVYMFLSFVDSAVLRSGLWQNYLNFCHKNNVLSIRKGEFFDKLSQVNFKVRRLDGDYVVIPPNKKPPLLVDAAEKRRLLASGLIEVDSNLSNTIDYRDDIFSDENFAANYNSSGSRGDST